MTLTERARAAQTAKRTQRHWAQVDQDTDDTAQQYTRALNVLARVIPAVLGIPFDPDAAAPHRVNSCFLTAAITIDGYLFTPAYETRTGLTVSDDQVTDLRMGVGADWYGNGYPHTQWLRITTLSDVAAALDAQHLGTVAGLQAFWRDTGN